MPFSLATLWDVDLLPGDASDRFLSAYPAVSVALGTLLLSMTIFQLVVVLRRARTLYGRRRGSLKRTRFNDHAISIQASGADGRQPESGADDGRVWAVENSRVRAPTSSEVESGYKIYRAASASVALLLLLVLTAYAWLHRTALLENPEKSFRVVMATLFMLAGILADILLTYAADRRSLRELKSEEVLTPLVASFVVFYALWTRLVSTETLLTACYNAFTSGLTWRRVLQVIRGPQSTS